MGHILKRREEIKMEMYMLMLKGMISEQPDEIKALYEDKRQEFDHLLLTEDEGEQIAIITAMLSALVDTGLLAD